jgi:hypothetical protein
VSWKRALLISVALPPLSGLVGGCAERSGVAYVEIENDQSASGRPAEPIFVDPSVEIVQNQYRRSQVNEGSNVRQTIRVKGPIMIVPAPPAAR